MNTSTLLSQQVSLLTPALDISLPVRVCLQSALVQAIFSHDETRVAELSSECDVNEQDELGRTALHAAAALGAVRMVTTLLAHGARVDCKERNAWLTPLHRACARQHVDVVQALVAAGAVVDAMSRQVSVSIPIVG